MARVWDTETGLLVHALPPLHRRGVNTAAFSPNGRTLTTAADDMTARVWDLMGDVEEPGECLHTLGWDRCESVRLLCRRSVYDLTVAHRQSWCRLHNFDNPKSHTFSIPYLFTSMVKMFRA